jgi:hypothetical protein
MSIRSFVIKSVEANIRANYIADVLYKQNIAKVSTISLIPYLKSDTVFQTAYITVAEWEDSESAYEFIQQLKYFKEDIPLVHQNNNWWSVTINNHNSGDMNLYTYSTLFPQNYFNIEEQEEQEEQIADIYLDDWELTNEEYNKETLNYYMETHKQEQEQEREEMLKMTKNIEDMEQSILRIINQQAAKA